MKSPTKTPDGTDRIEPWRLFLQAHSALVDTLEHELRTELDLPLTWFEVLLHLERSPEGRLRMTDLAGSLLLSKSGVTRLVDRMESAGLVERGVCASDRRGAFAVITRAGRALYRKALPVHLRGVEAHFSSHLSAAEQRAIAAGLRKVMEAVAAPSSLAS